MLIAVAFAFPCLSSHPSLQHCSLPLSSRVLKRKTNASISLYYNCCQGLTLFSWRAVKIMIEFWAKLHLMVKMCAQALPVKLSTVNTGLRRLSLQKRILRKVYIKYVWECERENSGAGARIIILTWKLQDWTLLNAVAECWYMYETCLSWFVKDQAFYQFKSELQW